MAANFNKPETSDGRAAVLTYIKDNLSAQAKLYDGETLTGTPTNAIRYSSANLQFEKWNGSAWVALPLNLLPLAGGTLSGSLTGTSANFTSALTVGGSAVWHAGNLTPSNYLPLGGGTMSGTLTTLNVQPDANNTRALGTDALRYTAVHATAFSEAGVTLSTKYSAAGHAHSYLPLSGGTLTGAISGTTASFTNINVGGIPVAPINHTHSYLSLSGGTLTGLLGGTSAAFSGLVSALSGFEIGNVADTTLSRVAAGRAAIEGREIVTLGFSASGARITRGTGVPSGGSDGDTYYQYT